MYEKKMNFFKRSSTSLKSLGKETAVGAWDQPDAARSFSKTRNEFQIATERIEQYCQVDIPTRTMGTLTSQVECRNSEASTERFSRVDSFTSMDSQSCWDEAVQANPATHDSEVSPGEWNVTVLRGVDSQTDCPDPADPLFWLSGSLEDVRKCVLNLISAMEEDAKDDGVRDALQLRADNILLRIEVADLKRKVAQGISLYPPGRVGNSLSTIPRNFFIAGLTGGLKGSATYIVSAKDSLPVTASLAPSSTVLGYVTHGDKVISSGIAEEMGGCSRLPILPRGWVTIRDATDVYLKSINN